MADIYAEGGIQQDTTTIRAIELPLWRGCYLGGEIVIWEGGNRRKGEFFLSSADFAFEASPDSPYGVGRDMEFVLFCRILYSILALHCEVIFVR